jgi:probable HAF family extracellular repeat protein
MTRLIAGFALGALSIAQGAAAQAPAYSVHDIGRLPGAYATHPMRINDSGTVAGWLHGPQTLYRAFVWQPGSGLVELPPPPGYTHNRATGISDNGWVTGVAQVGFDGRPRSWRYRNGLYELLPALTNGCYPLFANGVNNDGTVVGRTEFIDGCPVKAFYFSDATGLILFDAQDAMDVNNAGVATGQGFDSAYRFSPQTGYQAIGTLPPGYDDGAQGRAINDAGHVTGRSINAVIGPDYWASFLFRDATGMQPITIALTGRSSGEGLNDRDDVVGNDGNNSTSEMWAWIWTPSLGRRQLLEEVITVPNGFVSVANVRDINDERFIIAKARSNDPADGYAYGVVLVPNAAGVDAPGLATASEEEDGTGHKDDIREK